MLKVDFEYIDADKGFKANITVEIMPEVTLKKYKDLEVEKVNTKILKKNVDEAIELERKKNARIQPVDKKAKNGDIAVIDYEGFKDGKTLQGVTGSGKTFTTEGMLSISNALRVFSIRTLVAAKGTEANRDILSRIVRGRESTFLSTDFIL